MNQDQIIYRKINLIIAGIIWSVFIYSGFFAFTDYTHIIPSFNQLMTGESSISTGLSRSFSEIMHFRFQHARQLNAYGPALFTFFLIQLIVRLFLAFSSVKKYYTTKEIVVVDTIISISMFLVFFEPFIRNFNNN